MSHLSATVPRMNTQTRPGIRATDHQINYALYLLSEAGYRTDWMDKTFSRLGAGMNARTGTVEVWLAGMHRTEISRVIKLLKAQIETAR